MDDAESTLQRATLLHYNPGQSGGWIAFSDSSPRSEVYALDIRVVTWNIWEDERHADVRHPFILDFLFPGSTVYHVIMLQEVTIPFFDCLLQRSVVRQRYLVTDLKEQFELCPNAYSTVILIDKEIASGFDVAAAFMEYENTRMARGLNILELSRGGHPLIRFATSHFESHPEDRRKRARQFSIAAHLSTAPGLMLDSENDFRVEAPIELHATPAVVAGDCNIRSYDELSPFISPPFSFTDALFEALGSTPDMADPIYQHPTYGMTVDLSTRKGPYKIKKPSRLDYIFTRGTGLVVQKGDSVAGTLGATRIRSRESDSDALSDKDSEKIWASDHLGVWVTLKLDFSVHDEGRQGK